MFCHKCGNQIKDNDKLCESCGASVLGHEIKREEDKTDVVKWIGFVWTVIVNLITLGVAIAIYSNIYDNFQIIAISMLILIYLGVQSFSMIYGKTAVETAFAYDAEFKRLRKLLKDVPDEYEEEEMQSAKKKVSKAMVKMYINAGFLFVIYLIALWHLFGAL